MRRKRAASFRRRMRDPSGSPSSCLFRESDKSRGGIQLVGKLAERVGFEPTLPVKVNTLSKRAPSATRPSLRGSPEANQRARQGLLRLYGAPALNRNSQS